MKKFFLFIAVAVFITSINSCSKEDTNGSNPNSMGTFRYKVNGVQKSFYTVSGINYNEEVAISAYNGGTSMYAPPTEMIVFTVKSDVIGTDALVSGSLTYSKHMITYSPDTETININITSNNHITHILKGTFSGNFKTIDGSKTIKITEGTFDIDYYF